MTVSIPSIKIVLGIQTFVLRYVRSPSTLHFPTFSSQLVRRRRHWRTTWGPKLGYLAVSSVNCPNCSLQSSGPPIDSVGRRASHLLGSTASPQHNRSTLFFAVYLEAAFPLAYPREYSSVACHLVTMQLPEALRRLCPVLRPMIPPTLLPGCRSRAHEHPPHLLKGLRSPMAVRLLAWANWPRSPALGVGSLIGQISSVYFSCIKL